MIKKYLLSMFMDLPHVGMENGSTLRKVVLINHFT